jgi:hypothetical protein
MRVWHAFIDEGYKDDRSFCLGSVYAPEHVCKEMGTSLLARIVYENEKLALGGHPPISRYHATDCAGLYREFSPKRGWDHERQIKLTKRINEILIEEGAMGSIVGGGFADLRPHLDPSQDENDFWYTLCFKMLIHMLTGLLEKKFPSDRLKIFYDASPQFSRLAKSAFRDFMNTETTESRHEILIDCQPTTWKAMAELQLADYITLQGLWRIDGSVHGDNRIKKSLAGLVDEMPLSIERFYEQNFIDMIRMHENVQAGLPIDEGVSSKLMVLVPE